MPLYNSAQAYVFNLQTTSSAEAKRLWRQKIKEGWDWECAYCGSTKNADKYEKIKDWMKPEPASNLYRYGTRRNKVS